MLAFRSNYILGTKLGVFHQLSLWVFLSHFSHVKTEAQSSSVARGHSGCKWQNWSLNPGSTGDLNPGIWIRKYHTILHWPFGRIWKWIKVYWTFYSLLLRSHLGLFGKNRIRIYIIRTCAFLGNQVWQNSYTVKVERPWF